jgi:hypothetical protein
MTLASYLSAQIQDYHRPNLFSVYFDPIFDVLPPIQKIEYGSVLVRTSQIPGQTINTAYNLYNGKKNYYATGYDFDPITMDIFCDVGNKAHSFLLYWMDKVMPHTKAFSRIMNYKTEYVGKIEIAQHTRPMVLFGAEATNIKLINAFPTNITPVELTHDGQDDIVRFSATFIYDDIQYNFKNGIVSSLLSLAGGALGFL